MRKTVKSVISVLAVILLCLSLLSATAGATDSSTAVKATVGDPMVYLTQKWLNQQYGKVKGFGKVTENGKTGWDTVYGLLRALQYEMGITGLADSFGEATTAKYKENILSRQDGVTDNKYAILQGALWCKGYNPGYNITENSDGTVTFKGVFDEKVEKAVIELKKDAGFTDPDGVVTLTVMKALMSMDSFKLLSAYGGTAEIRQMQQELNRKYEAYTGLTPCDGIYGAKTNKALIYALQAEEGLPVGVANANFGVTTKSCCPEIPYTENSSAAKSYEGSYYTDAQIASFTKLLQYALLVNGFETGVIDGVYDEELKNAVKSFEKDYALTVDGVADKGVWMSLLTSSGDTSRSAVAADCATILTAEKAKTLYDGGYRYIGRYLTGTYNGGVSKAITRNEAQIIFDAGLNFFPIYQTSARAASYFTKAQGSADAKAAIEAALSLGLPKNTIIYFAVDYDATDAQIESGVLPYFESVSQVMKKSFYRTGIYGTRNVCISAAEKGYTVSSFVSDMSTGFSGNLGFSLPDNWAFDQFATVKIGSGDGEIEIDKNSFSGRDYGVSRLDAPHKHSYTSKAIKKPDCTNKGVTSYSCSCGSEYTEEVKATGHTAVTDKAVAATYKKTGLTKGSHCSVCGTVIVKQKTVAKLTFTLKAKTLKTNSITVKWSKVTGATKYQVSYSTNGKKWTKVKTNKTSLTVKKLKSGQNYRFKVKVVAGKNKGLESAVLKTATKPLKVTLSSVKSPKKKQAAVTWKTVSGVTGYEVTYSTTKKFTKKTTKTVTVKKAKTKKTTLKKLKSGKKYYVKVRAYKTVNGKKIYGAYSSVKTIKVK